MKLYGRTLREIYALLPWQYRMVMIAGAGFFALIIFHFAVMLFGPGRQDAQKGPVRIGALGWDLGVYDPSIAADPVSGAVWMAFSNVRRYGQMKKNSAPGIRIAQGRAPCGAFTAAEGFEPYDDDVLAPDGVTRIAGGTWRYETPSIVFDPGDAAAPWKLYAYKYMWTFDNSFEAARRYSMIALKTSKDPVHGWGPEKWVFGASAEYPPAPYGDLTDTRLNTLDPSLGNITMYTRPSAIVAGGTLYMTLSAFTEGGSPDRIVLIASNDHGATWRYAGTPLAAADAPRLGAYTRLGGATLLQDGDRVFLAAVLGDNDAAALGTFLFEFSDLAAGALAKNPETGLPRLVRHIPRHSLAPTATGGGYAAYSPACDFGIVTGEFSGIKNTFQIFKTLQTPSGD